MRESPGRQYHRPRSWVNPEERSLVFDRDDVTIRNLDRYRRVPAARNEVHRVVASDNMAAGRHGNEGSAPSPNHGRAAIDHEPDVSKGVELRATGRDLDSRRVRRCYFLGLLGSVADLRCENALGFLFVVLGTRTVGPPAPQRGSAHPSEHTRDCTEGSALDTANAS